ncbi:MAG: nitroreductase family protein [Synergistaceae bacterium]|nr:nitroreductase family protein [Synergistaceae bacterium]
MLKGKFENSVIYKRHSVRSFSGEGLSAEQIEHILHAGMAGPSAHNMQPWSFVVIDEKGLLEAIAKGHPYAKMTAAAELAVLVCAKKEVVDKDPFYQQDLGAAVENMLLAATEGGVGSCWCGVHGHAAKDIEKLFVDLLHIPGDIIPFALVVLGIPAKEAAPKDRFEGQRIHRNAW